MDQVQIFISYAREDQQRVEALYQKLLAAGYQPWLDREHLLPGQKWEPVIKQALEQSDFALVCLSATSINKRGFLQKEIKKALEHAEEKLEDDVWLIPARLDDCEVPQALSDIQWVDLFEDDGFDQLLRALEFQLKKPGRTLQSARAAQAKSQPRTQPESGPQQTVAVPNTGTAPGGSIFEFVTVRVDERGKVIDRQTKQARCFIEDLSYDVKLEMVEIGGGEFWMGSSEAEAQAAFADAKRYYKDANEAWYKAEIPRHRVKVSPFLMGKYPVTQAQWYEVMGDLPEISDELRGDHHPVVNVSWEEAVEFCRELTRRKDHQYRLPTEAEWEYACRAGTSTPFAFGPTLTPEIANYWWSHPYGSGPKKDPLQKTVAVGSQGVANAFGLYDMHGNVWEWCSDWYGASYYEECREEYRKKGVVADPQGPAYGSIRVYRGGGWYNFAVNCRSAYRVLDAPGDRYDNLGFRLLRTYR
jgi:formylglycine-generating enzyme required for sulfatase activity